jgi:hypothetical protein
MMTIAMTGKTNCAENFHQFRHSACPGLPWGGFSTLWKGGGILRFS